MQFNHAAQHLSSLFVFMLLSAAAFAGQQSPGGQNQPQGGQTPQQNQSSAQRSTANQPTSQPVHPPSIKAMESILASRIHMVNQLEIKAGEMAAKKGSAFDVREYGDRLQLDHKKADGMVLGYAKRHGLQVMSPMEIDTKMQQMQGSVPEAETKPQQMEHQGAEPGVSSAQRFQGQQAKIKSAMQKLRGLQGKAFDDAFTQFMVEGHTQAIAMLSMSEQILPSNSGLRSMVGKLIPVLEQHYDIAARLHIATVRRQNRALGEQLSEKMKRGRQP